MNWEKMTVPFLFVGWVPLTEQVNEMKPFVNVCMLTEWIYPSVAGTKIGWGWFEIGKEMTSPKKKNGRLTSV